MARLVTVEGDCLFSLQLPGFGAVELGWSGDRPTLTRLELDSDPSGPVIASSRDAGHVIYAPPGGEAGLLDYPMLAGVAVLCDHDAIRWQGHEFRYTVLDWLCADPEAADTYAGREGVLCPADMEPLEPGQRVCRCPTCGFVLHVDCVRESGACPVCATRALDGPEEIGRQSGFACQLRMWCL
jgi:hypothetical protein